jgi:hypothetical protein
LEEAVEEIEDMHTQLLSFNMILFDIGAKVHDDLVGVALYPVKDPLREQTTHGNDLNLRDCFLIDPVVILKSFDVGFILEEVQIKHNHLASN